MDSPASHFSIYFVTGATGGTVTLNDNGTPYISSDDFIVFSPDNNFIGKAGFDYYMNDYDRPSTATVTVNVIKALCNFLRAFRLALAVARMLMPLARCANAPKKYTQPMLPDTI